MKNRKSIITTIMAVALVAALAIGGTVAYLTDMEQTTNTFTVGEVKIDLVEDNYAALTAAEKSNLVPNQEVAKDPKVTNTGVNDAIVFLKVTVPVKNVTLVADDGTRGTKEMQEIFYLKSTGTQFTHANDFNASWIELSAKETGTDHSGATRTYVFGYNAAIAANASTSELFSKIQLKNVLEDELVAGADQEILVEAFGIQASEVLSASADLTDTLDATSLAAIYDIVVNQNSTVTARQATGGNLNLAGSANS